MKMESKIKKLEQPGIAVYAQMMKPSCDDIRKMLKKEGVYHRIRKTGHPLPQQGEEYVELQDVAFIADKPFIVDCEEYRNLLTGDWYERNYMPLIERQIPDVVNLLHKDNDTRQAILNFFNTDAEWQSQKQTGNMICTMYVQLRLFNIDNDSQLLKYTVNMRSLDAREYRSDYKFHRKVQTCIADALRKLTNKQIWLDAPVFMVGSLQCWDKDWDALNKDL